jgi:UDP-galactopyranose mutase
MGVLIEVDWLVVGAGLSGATFAERAANVAGARVLVVERREHIGGNAFDANDEYGVRIHRFGAHIFHTSSVKVWDYLSRFTAWLPYVHRVVAEVDGVSLPVPVNLTTVLALVPGNAGERLRERLIKAHGAGSSVSVLTLIEHPDPDLRALGELVYEKIFLGYTMKQWGRRPEEIDRSITGRVPIIVSHDDRYFNDQFQGIPADGYTAMVDRMLRHPNVAIETGVDYREIVDQVKFRRMLFTGQVDELFEGKHGWLPYRSLQFENIRIHVERVLQTAVKNFPAAEPFTRMIEHAHFSPMRRASTLITAEYPQRYVRGMNEPYYPLLDRESRQLYRKYAEEAQRIGDRVVLAGRLGKYRYLDMDQAVAHSLAIFENHVLRSSNSYPSARLRTGLDLWA